MLPAENNDELKSCRHDVADLVDIFNGLFFDSHNTLLQPGADEPLYQPAPQEGGPHIIHSSLDYYQSGLHEIAHWCIAGEQRRTQVDYGYWYTPDDRNAVQQHKFQKAEARPQALEWIFSQAVGLKFQLSRDNLNTSMPRAPEELSTDISLPVAEYEFEQAIVDAAHTWVLGSLPGRAGRFVAALELFYQRQNTGVFDPEQYLLNALIRDKL